MEYVCFEIMNVLNLPLDLYEGAFCMYGENMKRVIEKKINGILL